MFIVIMLRCTAGTTRSCIFTRHKQLRWFLQVCDLGEVALTQRIRGQVRAWQGDDLLPSYFALFADLILRRDGSDKCESGRRCSRSACNHITCNVE